MICNNCGFQAPDLATFCPNCGNRLQGTPRSEIVSYSPQFVQPEPNASSGVEQTQLPPRPQYEVASNTPQFVQPEPNVAYRGEQTQLPPRPQYEVPGLPIPPEVRQFTGVSAPGGPFLQRRKVPRIGVILGVLFLIVVLVAGGGFLFFQRSQSQFCSTTHGAVFCDDFTDNSKGWNTRSDSTQTIAIQDNTLILTSAPGVRRGIREPLPTNRLFDNFMLTFTYSLLDAKTQSVGALVRANNKLSSGYSATIHNDGTAFIVKAAGGPGQVTPLLLLATGVKVASLKPAGQQNTMTLIMKGPTLVLLMNGSVVTRVSDSDFKTGSIALEVSQGKVAFGSVAVYPAPANLPITASESPGILFMGMKDAFLHFRAGEEGRHVRVFCS